MTLCGPLCFLIGMQTLMSLYELRPHIHSLWSMGHVKDNHGERDYWSSDTDLLTLWGPSPDCTTPFCLLALYLIWLELSFLFKQATILHLLIVKKRCGALNILGVWKHGKCRTDIKPLIIVLSALNKDVSNPCTYSVLGFSMGNPPLGLLRRYICSVFVVQHAIH